MIVDRRQCPLCCHQKPQDPATCARDRPGEAVAQHQVDWRAAAMGRTLGPAPPHEHQEGLHKLDTQARSELLSIATSHRSGDVPDLKLFL